MLRVRHHLSSDPVRVSAEREDGGSDGQPDELCGDDDPEAAAGLSSSTNVVTGRKGHRPPVRHHRAADEYEEAQAGGGDPQSLDSCQYTDRQAPTRPGERKVCEHDSADRPPAHFCTGGSNR